MTYTVFLILHQWTEDELVHCFTSPWILYLKKGPFNSLVCWILVITACLILQYISMELIVPNCACPGMCALIIVAFLSVPPCAHVPMQACAHMWVYKWSTVTILSACVRVCVCVCVPMCVVRSLLVEFNPCVQGVTSPQHTRLHSYCSTLTFYSPLSPPTPFTFVLRGQLRKQTFSPR